MRTASTVAKVIMWIAVVFYVLLQLAAIVSIQLGNNTTVIEQGRPEEVYNIVPLLVTTVAMLAAVILFTVWKKRRYIGVLIALAAGVAIVVIAFDLGREFPVRVSGYDTDLGMVLVPLAMIPAWLCERAYMKSAEFQISLSREPSYDLSGAAIFVDEEGRREVLAEHRLKKSLRKKQQAAAKKAERKAE